MDLLGFSGLSSMINVVGTNSLNVDKIYYTKIDLYNTYKMNIDKFKSHFSQ